MYTRIVGLLLLAGLVAVTGLVALTQRPSVSGTVARVETVSVGDQRLRFAIPVSSARGLMGVEGVEVLRRFDGMLFTFSEPRSGAAGMWMKDVLVPLDAAFFDPDGAFMLVVTMPLCETSGETSSETSGGASNCPVFGPDEPFGSVIEAPAGSLHWIVSGDVLIRP